MVVCLINISNNHGRHKVYASVLLPIGAFRDSACISLKGYVQSARGRVIQKSKPALKIYIYTCRCVCNIVCGRNSPSHVFIGTLPKVH